jgi:hypothetical protein
VNDDYDDGEGDFPPVEHPVREFITASFFVLGILAFVCWLLWRWI